MIEKGRLTIWEMHMSEYRKRVLNKLFHIIWDMKVLAKCVPRLMMEYHKRVRLAVTFDMISNR